MIHEHGLAVRKRGLEAGDVGVYPQGGYVGAFVDHKGNALALRDLSQEALPLEGLALLGAKAPSGFMG